MDTVQAALAAHADILERVLQFRPVHRTPRANHPGPELPDSLHSAADKLGVLRPAVFTVGGQHLWRTF